MSCYLLEQQEIYRFDTEHEVDNFLNHLKKHQTNFTLTKSSSAYRTRKKKGEVVDSWYKVIITKSFDDEKSPEFAISIDYSEDEEG